MPAEAATRKNKSAMVGGGEAQPSAEPEATSLRHLHQHLKGRSVPAPQTKAERVQTPAVLVGPKYGSSIGITEEEHEAALNLIRWRRAGNKEAEALCYALSRTTTERVAGIADGDVLRCLLSGLMEQLGEHAEEVQALVIDRDEAPIRLLEKEGQREIECIKALLAILRAKGWFADYLSFSLPWFADKSPVPLQVIDSLSETAFHFDCDIADAKDMIRKWPHLFEQLKGLTPDGRGN